MAGFDKIKRKLIKKEGEVTTVVFEDTDPYKIEYQKFYSDDEMLWFSHHIFADLPLDLEAGTYVLEIDTLNSYIDSATTYVIEQRTVCSAVSSNLNNSAFAQLPDVIYTKDL